jgi:hypothetical protein
MLLLLPASAPGALHQRSLVSVIAWQSSSCDSNVNHSGCWQQPALVIKAFMLV